MDGASPAASPWETIWLGGGVEAVFRIAGAVTGGRLSVVEHPMAPGSLIEPHTHHREDEYSYVLARSDRRSDRRSPDAHTDDAADGRFVRARAAGRPRTRMWRGPPRRSRVLAADVPTAKSAVHALLRDTVHAAGASEAELRLVVDVDAYTVLTVQARTALLREFPMSRPSLRLVLRSRSDAPSGLLRAARAAGVPTVTR